MNHPISFRFWSIFSLNSFYYKTKLLGTNQKELNRFSIQNMSKYLSIQSMNSVMIFIKMILLLSNWSDYQTSLKVFHVFVGTLKISKNIGTVTSGLVNLELVTDNRLITGSIAQWQSAALVMQRPRVRTPVEPCFVFMPSLTYTFTHRRNTRKFLLLFSF